MKTLKKSPNKDQDVIVLQSKLNEARRKVHGNWPHLITDGVFGKQTEYAVKSFQEYAYINRDGIVGPITWEKLNEVCYYRQLYAHTLENIALAQKSIDRITIDGIDGTLILEKLEDANFSNQFNELILGDLTAIKNDIVRKAIENNIKKISFFWSNGTKFNAKALAREIQREYPNISIDVLENSLEGIQMEKLVNRKLVEEGLRQGYTKEELFVFLKKNELWGIVQKKAPSQFMQSLQALQRRKSRLYAKSAKYSDWNVRFMEVNKGLGPASIEEQKVLDKNNKTVDDYALFRDDKMRRVMNPDGSTRIITSGRHYHP